MVATLIDAPRISRDDWGAHYRCDRCPQPAVTLATKVVDDKEIELMFCGHHGNKYFDLLIMQEFTVEHNPVVDER